MLDVRPQSVRQLIDFNLKEKNRSAHEILYRFRNSLVVRALRLSDGKIRPAARLLQISPQLIKTWMREANIDLDLYDDEP